MNDTIKGKYRIVREIARSNDIVYEAVDTSLGRRIALKELNIAPGMTGQVRRERIERFNREARAAGRLHHANIVTVFEFGEENGRHFIAMEYLEGQTLRDLMQTRGTLPLKEAVDIACQVLDALAYAHAHKVIHRDIKPDNIHVLPGGVIKLTDFGIARLAEEPALTSNGQVFGTPSYMSPEQIEGKGIDHRSDLFSLGVLLYEMLSGRKPFNGDSVIAITYAIMNAEPSPLIGVPTGVEQIVHRALSKNPNNRFASAGDMNRELRKAEQSPYAASPQRTGMGVNMSQTGMGGPYPGSGTNYPGNPNRMPSLPSLPGYGGPAPLPNSPYTGMNNMPAAAPDANGLPWTWNTPGGAQGGRQNRRTRQTQQQLAQQYAQQAAPMAVPGMDPNPAAFPFVAPPQPRKREPLIVLSPEARANFNAFLIAVVIGSGLGLGIYAFMNRYQTYESTVSSEQVHRLMTQAGTAYAAKDFTTAISFFEQALNARPSAADRATIQKELGWSYLELARQARVMGKVQEALEDCKRSLSYLPDYQQTHQELSILKESMHDPQGAQAERVAAQTSTITQQPPDTLQAPASGGATPSTSNIDPNQFTTDRRAQAQQLLREGDSLYQNGNLSAARDKWSEARDKAPGLPEHDQAENRLNQIDNTGGQ